MNNKLFTIQEAADILGVSSKTLRRWDQRGRFVPTRTAGNQRRYTQEQIDQFKIRSSKFKTVSSEVPPLFSENEASKEIKAVRALPSVLRGLPSGSFLKNHFFLRYKDEIESRMNSEKFSEPVSFARSHLAKLNPFKVGFVVASLVLILSLAGSFVLAKYNVVAGLAETKEQFAKFIDNLPQISFQIKTPLRQGSEGQARDPNADLSFVPPDIFGAVLAAATGGSDLALNINVPTFFSQKVGIGTAVPDASAILDLVSEEKGFLAPRMTSVQRDAITSPAAGLFVYNTDTNQYNMYNGTSWDGVSTVTAVGDVTTGEAFTETGASGKALWFNGTDGGKAKITAGSLSGTKVLTLPNATGTIITTGNLSSITTTGTIGTGVWNGTVLTVAYGGTGVSTLTGLVVGNGSGIMTAVTASTGVAGQISDETGTGLLVFGTSPAITTSLTTGSTSFDLLNTTATTLNFAGAATTLSVGAATGTVTLNNATTAITGALTANGDVTLGNATTDNITFTGRVAQDSDLLPIGTTGTNDLGSTSLPWDNLYANNVIAGGTSGIFGWLQRNANALSPTNITDDFLLGATSTGSAKFAFLNVAGGTPTASISANSGSNATTLTGLGVLGTTNMQTLTLGNSTTGNIVIDSGSSVITLSDTISPTTTDGAALGTTALMWSDLFLASGSVINFNNGDVTFTHASNALTFAGGNVGFGGQATPLTELDVTGSASLSANLSLRGSGTAHTFNILDNGTLNFTRSPGGDAVATTAMFIQGDGNVGIRQTAPLGNLHIGTTAVVNDTKVYIQSDAANRPRLYLYSGATNNMEISVGSTADIVTSLANLNIGAGGASELTLTATALSPAVSDGNALGTTSLLWSDLFLASGAVVNFNNGDVTLTHASNALTFAGGNVGFGGQATPLTELDVTGSASLSANLSLRGSGTAHTFNILDNGTLNFQRSPSGDAGLAALPVLYLMNNGNVGIGLTAPTAKLEINGGINLTGAQTIQTTTGNLTMGTGGGNGNIILSPNGTGNVGIKASTPTTFDLEVGGNIGASTGSTYDLGSSARRWNNVYGVTANFTNFTTSLATISGTTVQDFLINSDNATTDAEDATLSFSRGTNNTNSQFKWNSTTKQLSTNSPSFAILPDSTIAYSGTSALMVNQVQSQDILTASASGTTRFTIANSGDTTIVGDLAVNGGDITTNQTTGNLFNATATTLNIGGAATTLSIGAATGTVTLNNATTAITGALTANGDVTLGNATTDNITFTGRVAQDSDLLPIGTTGTNDLGSSALPWDNLYANNVFAPSSGTAGYWQRNSNAISPTNITDDFLLGATSTTSAKFAFLNVAGGTPTASISANSGSNATTLTGLGVLGTTNMQTLTLGNSTTGNIVIDSGSSAITFSDTISPTTSDGAALGTTAFMWSDLFLASGSVINFNNGDVTLTHASNALTFAGGNVGFGGQATPLTELDVTGSASLSANLSLRGSGTAHTFNILQNGTLNFTRSPGGDAVATTSLFIQGDGNVGIGNTAPGAMLSVGSSTPTLVSSAGLITVANTTDSTSGITGSINTLGGVGITKSLWVGGSANSAQIFSALGTALLPGYSFQSSGTSDPNTGIFSSAADTVNFATGGTERVRIDSAGNVGIGTTSPLAALDVRGNLGTVPAASISATSSFASLIVDNAGAGDLFTASSSGLTRFVIKQSGLVSIGGMTAPTSGRQLTVAQTSGSSSDIVRIGDFNTKSASLNTGGATIEMVSYASSGQNNINFIALSAGAPGDLTIGLSRNSDLGTGGNIYLNTLNSGSYTTKMTITASGNVGIGTTAPVGVLQVSGIAAGNAAAIINNAGSVGDIFTASASGSPKFVITNAGNVGIAQTLPTEVLGVTGNATISGTLLVSTIKPPTGALNLQYKSGGNAWTTGLTLLDNSGNVGIGNTAPGAMLSVGSSTPTLVSSAGLITVANTTDSTSGITGSINTLGGVGITKSLWVGGSANSAQIFSALGTALLPGYSFQSSGTSDPNTGIFSSAADTVNFSTGGTEAMRIDSSQRVGINNTAPLTALDVTGSASLSANLSLRGAATAHLLRILDNGTLNIQRSPGGDAVATTSLFIQGDGNVGIGNTAPLAMLSVGSSTPTLVSSAGLITVANTTDSTSGITGSINTLGGVGITKSLWVGGSANSAQIFSALGTALLPGYSFQSSGTSDPNTGIFSSAADTVNFSTGGTEAMRIDSSQRVGIGTTAPLELLHVAGNATASGNLTLSGGNRTIQTTALNTLTIGGTTTGNIVIDSGSSVITFSDTISPTTTDGAALGTTALMWSDLFLASGSVINFNNGDVTLTHASNALTFAGGNVGLGGQATPLTELDVTGSASISANLSLRGSGTAHTFNILQNGTLNFTRSPGGDAVATTSLFIQGDGNVGIGNTAPLAMLSVGSSTPALISSAGLLTVANTTDTTSGITGSINTLGGVGITKSLWVGGSANSAQIFSALGTALLPGYSFQSSGTSDPNTGIFSSAADTVNFATGGTEAMRIDSSQRVGIGTTAPATILSYTNSGKGLQLYSSAAQVRITSSGTSGSLDIIDNDATVNQRWFTIFNSAQIVNFRKLSDDSNTATDMMTFDMSSGNVGIGTTAPRNNLDITGSASLSANLTLNGAGTAHTFNVLDNGTLNFQRWPSGDGANNSTVMFLSNNGNVGIGTTAPTALLHVVLGSTSMSAVEIDKSTTNTSIMGTHPFLRIQNTNSTANNIADINFFNSGGNVVAGISAILTHSAQTGQLQFSTVNAGTVSNAIRIDNAGSVGIGNTAPGAMLSVGSSTPTLVSSAGLLTVANTTDSTSGSTGSINTLGGLGVTKDIAVDGGDIVTAATTFNLINATATTVNFAGASTTLAIGATTGTASIRNTTVNFPNATAIGIGNTAPLAALDVTGSASISANLSLRGSATAHTFDMLDGGSLNFQRTVGGSSFSSTLFLQNTGNVGIGTTVPGSLLTLANNGWFSGIATASGVTNMFKVNTADQIQVGAALNIDGSFNFPSDSGYVTAMDIPLTSGQSANTANGYVFRIGSDNIMTIYGENNGSGTLQNGRVGIGTTAPLYKLDVQDTQTGTAAAQIYNAGATGTGLALKLNFTGGGAATNVFASFLNGNGLIQGMIKSNASSGVTYQTNGVADFAEYFKKDQNSSIPFGSVVCFDNNGLAVACDNNSNKIVGVASEHPAFLGGKNLGDKSVAVGLVGQVRTRVSSANGVIKIGDPLTTSSTAGVAVKAVSVGQILGKAIEPFDGAQGQEGDILVSVNITWYNPSIYVSYDGTLAGMAATVSSIGDQLALQGDALQAQIASTSARLQSLEATASGGQASLAAKTDYVLANDSLFTSLQNKVSSLESKIDLLSLQMEQQASISAFLTQIVNSQVLGASTSAALSLGDIELNNATIAEGLMVLGRTTVTDLGVTGNINAGLLAIHGLDGEINTLSGDLYLQKNGFGGVNILAGKVTIDTQGNMTVAGILSAKQIEAENYTVLGQESIGSATILAGLTSIEISTLVASESSKIFLTSTSLTDKQLTVIEKSAGKFKVAIPQPTTSPISFDWWIVGNKN